MNTHAPEAVIHRFAEALEHGDIEGMLDLYEPDATFAPQPGTTVTGTDEIRRALAPFVAASPAMTGEIRKVTVAGDTALVTNNWSMRGTGPDGEPMQMSGTSADVLRRGMDGTWRIAIDDPWGAGA